VPNEYFRPDFTAQWSAEWGLRQDSSYRAYVEAAKRRTTTANGIFSAKLHWYQFTWLCRQIRMQDNAGKEQSTPESLAGWFPGLRYVFLWRRDTARQAISYYRAATTQLWFVTSLARGEMLAEEIEFQQIRWFEDILLEHRAGWQDYFARSEIIPLEVAYEDLAGGCQTAVRRILSFLGAAGSQQVTLGPPTLRRQADGDTEVILQKYLSMRNELPAKPDDLFWSAEDKKFLSPSLDGVAGVRK
jgi:LPS sulfotransferase NodH